MHHSISIAAFYRYKMLTLKFNYSHIHMYIHNWLLLQCFNRDDDLASHTIYAVCVNFMHERRGLQLKVDSERQIFDKFFMVILLNLRVYV